MYRSLIYLNRLRNLMFYAKDFRINVGEMSIQYDCENHQSPLNAEMYE
jgi:hypothetical protein